MRMEEVLVLLQKVSLMVARMARCQLLLEPVTYLLVGTQAFLAVNMFLLLAQ